MGILEKSPSNSLLLVLPYLKLTNINLILMDTDILEQMRKSKNHFALGVEFNTYFYLAS